MRGDILREALSSAIMGYTLRAVDNRQDARKFLRRSLQIGIKDGNYLALLYGLPIAALYLADENRHERAVEIYAQVESHPTIGCSVWWSDVVGHEIYNAGSSLSPSEFEAAKARGISLDLWETAQGLLDDFL